MKTVYEGHTEWTDGHLLHTPALVVGCVKLNMPVCKKKNYRALYAMYCSVVSCLMW